MNRLKDLRLKMGLSQQALADKLNVSQQTICKYENNTNEPNIDMLEAMADIFDETALNEDELAFLKKYRSINPSSRALVQQFMDEFLRLSGE